MVCNSSWRMSHTHSPTNGDSVCHILWYLFWKDRNTRERGIHLDVEFKQPRNIVSNSNNGGRVDCRASKVTSFNHRHPRNGWCFSLYSLLILRNCGLWLTHSVMKRALRQLFWAKRILSFSMGGPRIAPLLRMGTLLRQNPQRSVYRVFYPRLCI